MGVISMKQNVSPWIIGSIIAVVLIVVIVLAKNTLFRDPNYSPVPWEQTKAYKEQQRAHALAQTPDAAQNVQPAQRHPQGGMAAGQ